MRRTHTANPEAVITAVSKGLNISDELAEALDIEAHPELQPDYDPDDYKFIPAKVTISVPRTVITPAIIKPAPWPTRIRRGPATDEYLVKKAKETIDLLRGRVV